MIFTFYSYKGGVGRSMALAAVAYEFARRGLKVLTVDFDLEAPGLEQYFFDGERSRAKRAQKGLIDLIQAYRRALTDEEQFNKPEFRDLHLFTTEAIVVASSRGGSVGLMTAGRRDPDEQQEYAQTVRSFDWQDFFYNWKGDQFFDWLRRQWNDPHTGYDVVLVDSRTGVTEMGGICAYQLADVAVLLCAPNYQNLLGTRDVARDFISKGVLGLRHGRPLEILAIPARLEANHPRREEFLQDFERELGTEGMPFGLAQRGIGYRDLALPYMPEFSIGDLLVGGDDTSQNSSKTEIKAFERLADALTLMADPATKLGHEQAEALARLRKEPVPQPAIIQADTSRVSAGYDAFVDCGTYDTSTMHAVTEQLEAKGLQVFMDSAHLQPGMDWGREYERALEYSANVLICFGQSASSPFRTLVLEKARRTTRTRIIPILLPGADEAMLRSFGLENIQCIDLRKDVEESIAELTILLKRQPPTHTEGSKIKTAKNPYLGESPYSEDDAQFFHGREAEVSNLSRAINEFHIVLLEGPAKVGKTSLVNAGLVPKLRKSGTDKESWNVGRLALLDAAAATFDVPSWIKERPQGQVQTDVIDVCIVDSLDTTCLDASTHARRLQCIQDILTHAGDTLRMLLVWRGTIPDEQYETLLQTLNTFHFHRLILEPMKKEQVRRAIEQPARDAGHLLENGLADRLIEGAGNAKNAIFQIQLALSRLWNERRRGWLTNKSLDGFGHLGKIFQDHINGTLDKFEEPHKRAVSVLFQRLSQLDLNLKLLSQPQAWKVLETIPVIREVGANSLRDRLAENGLIDLWREQPPNYSATPVSLEETAFVALARPNPIDYFGGAVVPNPAFFFWRKQIAPHLLSWETSRKRSYPALSLFGAIGLPKQLVNRLSPLLITFLNHNLLLKGGVLADAEQRLQDFGSELTTCERMFIKTSKVRRITFLALKSSAFVVLIIAVFFLKNLADKNANLAEIASDYGRKVKDQLHTIIAQRLAEDIPKIMKGELPGGEERAFLQTLAAWQIASDKSAVSRAMQQALAGTMGLVKIWPTGTPVQDLAISKDGHRLASVGKNHTIKIWDPTTGTSLGQPWKAEGVRSVAFSPDGSRIISGGSDQYLRLWNASTSEPIGLPWKGHTKAVTRVAFSPDGRRVVSASMDETIYLWDVPTGKPIGLPWKGHTKAVTRVAFSPDGRYVVSAGEDQTVRLWNATTGKPIGLPWVGHTDAVTSLAFSPDGTRVVSASADQTVRLWNATTGKPIGQPWTGHTEAVTRVAFSSDGTHVVSASMDQTLRLWNVSEVTQKVVFLKDLNLPATPLPTVTFSPDRNRVLTGGGGKLKLWNAPTGELIRVLGPQRDQAAPLAFSPDSSRIVSISADQSMRLWDAKTGQLLRKPWKAEEMRSVAFSHNAARVVSVSADQTLWLWDVGTGKMIVQPQKAGGVTSVSLSPKDSKMVSASEDKTIWLWNVDNGEVGTPWAGHTEAVTRVAFSPDGRRVVSASMDQTIRLWDANDGKPIGQPWKAEGVTSVEFTSDGKRVISESAGIIRVWDVDTGQLLGQPWQGMANRVANLEVTPQGLAITFANMDEMLKLVQREKEWSSLLCAKLTRNMSDDEWRNWVRDIPYQAQCPSLPKPANPSASPHPET